MLPIFPKTIDNIYRGQWLAFPLLVLVAASKMAMSFNAVFNTRIVIEQADKIPLNHYGADAIPLIIYMFQAWGIGQFLFAVLVLLALIRYRTMIPLATLFMLAEQVLRLILRATTELPGVTRDGTSLGALFVRGVLVVTVIALILALWPRASARVSETAA